MPVGCLVPVLSLVIWLNSWTGTLGPGSLQAQVGSFSADGGPKVNIYSDVNFSAGRGAKININFNIGWRVAAAAAASPRGCPGGSRAHSDASSSTPTRRATLRLAL